MEEFLLGLIEIIAHVFDGIFLDDDVDKDGLRELLTWVGFAKASLTVADPHSAL